MASNKHAIKPGRSCQEAFINTQMKDLSNTLSRIAFMTAGDGGSTLLTTK